MTIPEYAKRQPSEAILFLLVLVLVIVIGSQTEPIDHAQEHEHDYEEPNLRQRRPALTSSMNTKVTGKDLTKEPPRSPRIRVGGYAILGRTLDKCRALIAGNIGEYHFDCPLDNMLFGFKGRERRRL